MQFVFSFVVLNHHQEGLSLFLSQTIKAANTAHKLKRADVIRHVVSAKEQWRKVCGCCVVWSLFRIFFGIFYISDILSFSFLIWHADLISGE